MYNDNTKISLIKLKINTLFKLKKGVNNLKLKHNYYCAIYTLIIIRDQLIKTFLQHRLAALLTISHTRVETYITATYYKRNLYIQIYIWQISYTILWMA